MEEQSNSLLVTWKYDENDQQQQGDFEERDMLTGSTSSSNTMTSDSTPPVWRRWSKRISNYWETQQQRRASGRPDSLEYDFVAPTETARTRLPHRYDEKTVRLAPNGSYYLRNRYKQKV